VYDYIFGGAHNFAVDRELGDELIRRSPDVAETMRANRVFLRRAVRFLVAIGVRQFLDIGSGVPTVGNVHEIAQHIEPDSTVVYVDIDPVQWHTVRRSLKVMIGPGSSARTCAIQIRSPRSPGASD